MTRASSQVASFSDGVPSKVIAGEIDCFFNEMTLITLVAAGY